MVVFSTVWHRILELTGAKTDAELGDFLGITQAAVGKQRRKQKIPNTWYDVIRKKTGTTWEQLNAQPVAPIAPAVSQVAVANGHDNHVTNSAQAAPVVPAAGDIANNLCQLIRDRMAGLDMDEQIELRAKVKRALEEGKPEEGEPKL